MTSIAFLLGAGASVDAGIPTMAQFTRDFSRFIKTLGRQYTSVLDIYHTLAALHSNIGSNTRFNLEHLYSYLYKLNRDLAIPTSHLNKSRDTELAEYFLKLFILSTCAPSDPRRLTYLSPLLTFFQFGKSLNIFSLNYDTCIEQLCARNHVPIFDGFSRPASKQRWSPRLFESNLHSRNRIVQLVKLHGSVLWYEDPSGRIARLSNISTLRHGGAYDAARPLVPERLLLYPATFKSAIRDPYYSLFGYFRKLLMKLDLLIVVGYSFPDEHIQEVTLEAARHNKRLRLLIVDPSATAVATRIANAANLDAARITVLDGPKGFAKNALRGDRLYRLVRSITS